jgi:hypothetical protein
MVAIESIKMMIFLLGIKKAAFCGFLSIFPLLETLLGRLFVQRNQSLFERIERRLCTTGQIQF